MMDRSDPELQMLWSPLSRDGQERFTKLRAAIHLAYGAQNMQPPTQEQRLRERYAKAARRSADEMFFETFGSQDQLLRQSEDDDMCADLFQRSDSHRAHAEPEPEPEVEREPTQPTTYANPRLQGPTSNSAPLATTSAFSSAGFLSSLSAPSSFGFHRASHVSQLAKPTRLKTPKRISLKRPRVEDGMEPASVEKAQPLLRKPRITLSDTTNLMHASTTTTTMTNPWDRHKLKSSSLSSSTGAKPLGVSSAFATKPMVATSAFGLLRAPSAAASHAMAATTRPAAASDMLPSTRMFALR